MLELSGTNHPQAGEEYCLLLNPGAVISEHTMYGKRWHA